MGLGQWLDTYKQLLGGEGLNWTSKTLITGVLMNPNITLLTLTSGSLVWKRDGIGEANLGLVNFVLLTFRQSFLKWQMCIYPELRIIWPTVLQNEGQALFHLQSPIGNYRSKAKVTCFSKKLLSLWILRKKTQTAFQRVSGLSFIPMVVSMHDHVSNNSQ